MLDRDDLDLVQELSGDHGRTHPRNPGRRKLVRDLIIAKQIAAGDARSFAYAAERSGLSPMHVVPARTYGKNKRYINTAYATPGELGRQGYHGPFSMLDMCSFGEREAWWEDWRPVFLRGLRSSRIKQYKRVSYYRADILERFFRIKKFTCASPRRYWNAIQTLEITCRYETWRGNMHIAAELLQPTHLRSWFNGELIETATNELQREDDVGGDAEIKIRQLREQAEKLSSDCARLQHQVDSLLSGSVEGVAEALLNRSGQHVDSVVKELYLRVEGGRGTYVVRAWYLKRSSPGVYPARYMKLGNFGAIPLDDARALALRALKFGPDIPAEEVRRRIAGGKRQSDDGDGGRETDELRMARQMLKDGASNKVIAEVTGLSKGRVSQIKRDQQPCNYVVDETKASGLICTSLLKVSAEQFVFIRANLEKLLKTKQFSKETLPAYAKRLAMSVDGVSDKQWGTLDNLTQMWVNGVVEALDKGYSIPLPPGGGDDLIISSTKDKSKSTDARVRYVGKSAQEAQAIAQALYEMGIIKPGELQL